MSNYQYPQDVLLAITYRCNAKCKMCKIWAMKNTLELPVKEFSKIRNMNFVNISGGEPFLRDDIVEIVEKLDEGNNKNIVICTNGLVGGCVKKIEEISAIRPDIRITVSIDGIGKKHDSIRGVEGAFNKTIDLLEFLQLSTIKKYRVGFTASDYNADQIIDVYNLAKKYGAEFSITAAYNSVVRYETDENEINNLDLLKVNLNKLIDAEISQAKPKNWLRAYYAYGLKKFVDTGIRVLPVHSSSDGVFIHSDGRVILSVINGSNVGKLQDCKDLRDLFESSHAQSTIKQSNQIPVPWIPYNVRPAMKRHPIKVLSWVMSRKLKSIKYRYSDKYA